MQVLGYDFTTNESIRLIRPKLLIVDDIAIVRTSNFGSYLRSQRCFGQRGDVLIQRCVIMTKEMDGFELRIANEYPVLVQMAKEAGAAFRAGVRQGDRIIKINGVTVTDSNYLEVVRMITGQMVALTLLGKPPEFVDEIYPDPLGKPIRPAIDNGSFPNSQSLFAGSRLITDEEKIEEWLKKRVQIISQMLDDARLYLDELRQNAVSSDQLKQTERQIINLDSQLNDFDSLTQDPSPMPSAGPKCVHISTPSFAPTTSASIQGQLSLDSSEVRLNQPFQMGMVSMEEQTDENETETVIPLDTHGPFSNLADLKCRPAHLAVFINYLLCNSSPNTLFFYLITDVYQNANGICKEFRKWAYEIFSTFLIPNAPLHISNINQSIVKGIDKVLSTPSTLDQDDSLKELFLVARQLAIDDVVERLADFLHKRRIGLNSVFDHNMLAEVVIGDRNKEQKVADLLLMSSFERLFAKSADFETLSSKAQALACSFATIIKFVLSLRPSNTGHEKLLDKCPTFVTRDKGGVFKLKSMASKRSVQVKGHQFLLNSFNVPVYCHQCKEPVWGINAQAYVCTYCEYVLHKQCSDSLVDSCYTTMHNTKQLLSRAKQKRQDRLESGEEEASSARDMTGFTSISSDSGLGVELTVHDKSVGRSQSMRFQKRRDKSAFSWCEIEGSGSDGSDVGVGSGARRVKSDVEDMVSPRGRGGMDVDVKWNKLGPVSFGISFEEEEAGGMLADVEKMAIQDDDSDLEVSTEIPSLESIISPETMRLLRPKEKKRQEVINELFHTERTHVRNLKVLHRLFYTPLLVQQVIPPNIVKLLFANIDDVLQVHDIANKAMRVASDRWMKEHGLYSDIGALMLSMLDGDSGQRLRTATASFCRHQQYALDVLRNQCKDDESLSKFLVEAETNPLCRKLQLKDMLPVEMQRLVKYPLLLETIAKYTSDPSEELDRLRKAVDLSRTILSSVNTAKRRAENLRRLDLLQQRLDTQPFDRENFAIAQTFRHLDLRQFTLVHDGPLSWRFPRGKMVDLHAVLLEGLLVLLSRVGDGNRLVLRCQEPNKDTRWVPLLPVGPLIAKEKAGDKKAFFVVNNSPFGAQIYELLAATGVDRKTWLKVLSEQIESANRKSGRTTSQFLDETLNDACPPDDNPFRPDRLHICTHPRLVTADEILIRQPTILEPVQPVLTLSEQLDRHDRVIVSALLDKQRILARLSGPENVGEELDRIADLLSGLDVADLKQKESTEIAISAIVQGNRLLDAINKSMNLTKTEVPETLEHFDSLPSVACYRLTAIAAPLMNHLKTLMYIVQEQNNEIRNLRDQLVVIKPKESIEPVQPIENPVDH